MAAPDMEKLEHLNSNNGDGLTRQVTLQLSPEQYEKLFFQPSPPRRGDFAKRFGNPTLLGVLGFLIPFTPTVFSWLAFKGADITSTVGFSGSFYFFGGIAMGIAGICEFVLGNTFTFVLFIVYGAHWCNIGYVSDPLVNLVGSYGENGATGVPYTAGQGFYNVAMVLTSFVFFFASIKTNVPLSMAIFCLIFVFSFCAAAEFKLGHVVSAADLNQVNYFLKVAGGFGMITVITAWYLAIVLALASTEVPVPLPVFDLSTKIPSPKKRKDLEADGDDSRNQ